MPEAETVDDRIPGFLISRDPLILWGPSTPPYLAGPGSRLGPHIGNQRAYFLFSPAWTRERDDLVRMDLRHLAELRARWPEHRHLVLLSTRAELERYRIARQPAAVCTASIFLDETIFDIQAGRVAEFDAIYNGQLVPFKRHELCVGVKSLALIYHRHSDPLPYDHAAKVREWLPHATFVNERDGPFHSLAPHEVASWLNRARVGLILSAQEGQNRATAEYLLCGLPVVTTPNIGGRNRVLHPSYAVEVQPDPEAVAKGVTDLIARQLDPYMIRRAVLERLEADRSRLLKIIAAIFEAEGKPFPENADWQQLYRRGTWPMQPVETLFASTAVAETRKPGAPPP